MIADFPKSRWIGILGFLILFAWVSLAPASAGEITIFVSQDHPTDVWSYGQGASLTMRFFKVLMFDVEAARNLTKTSPLRTETARMTYFTGSIALALPIPQFTPYAGFGTGLFHQRADPTTDLGTLETILAGVRFRLADLIVLRAEYRRFELGGTPLFLIDDRYSIGAGIAF